MMRDITDKEWEGIEIARRFIKGVSGHGTLTIEYRNGVETQFVPAPKIVPKT
jgi:hypothetical protein